MNLDKIIAVRKGKTVYKDGDNCIKVFNENYSKADILNEALNQARVEELPINVPKIKAVTKIDEKWAIVTEYIEGKTLAQLMTENSDKIDEYLEKFIDLQLQVQSNTSPLLTKLKEKFIKKIYLAEVDPNLKYDLHTRLDSMAKGYSVCHGDFNPSNIIIGENGKCQSQRVEDKFLVPQEINCSQRDQRQQCKGIQPHDIPLEAQRPGAKTVKAAEKGDGAIVLPEQVL